MRRYLVPVAITVVALAALYVLSPTFDQHEGTAAWVQAVGSVGAIIAATWIAGRESRENQKREAERKRQLWEGIATISENSMKAFKKLDDACQPIGDQRQKFITNYNSSDFDVSVSALAAIPLHEIGDLNLITAVATLRAIMGNLQNKLADAFHKLDDPAAPFDLAFLGGQKTSIFNAHASVWRSVHGTTRENDLSKLAS